MEKVRPGTGREAGLGHAGGRAPKVGALGDAGAIAEKPGRGDIIQEELFVDFIPSPQPSP
jgi:hypothetical protein